MHDGYVWVAENSDDGLTLARYTPNGVLDCDFGEILGGPAGAGVVGMGMDFDADGRLVIRSHEQIYWLNVACDGGLVVSP